MSADITQKDPHEPASHSVISLPPTNRGLLAAAGVCLLVPVVALMWVSSYARTTPRLGGIPFFFWYQFAWVFITSALTYTAHRLVLAARSQRDNDHQPDLSPRDRGGDSRDTRQGVRS